MDTVKSLATLKRIRRIARLLDTAIGIPGTKFRIGLDPILGLIPGGGDLISGGISLYMIYLATRFGLAKEEIGKMLLNVGIETVAGSVPLIGDLFDAYFKANMRNLEILERHLEQTKELQPITTETKQELKVS